MRPTLLQGFANPSIICCNCGSISSATVATTVQSPQPNHNRSGRATMSAKLSLYRRSNETSISTILTTVLDTPHDAERLRKNPLGVFVHAINWSKELG